MFCKMEPFRTASPLHWRPISRSNGRDNDGLASLRVIAVIIFFRKVGVVPKKRCLAAAALKNEICVATVDWVIVVMPRFEALSTDK